MDKSRVYKTGVVRDQSLYTIHNVTVIGIRSRIITITNTLTIKNK
jgi:hypothetical protein